MYKVMHVYIFDKTIMQNFNENVFIFLLMIEIVLNSN